MEVNDGISMELSMMIIITTATKMAFIIAFRNILAIVWQ